MLLPDVELEAELASGRLAVEPHDPTLVQPASIDVRLDRHFRVFHNHRYDCIDPAVEQDALTELVSVAGDGSEAFILHPGEFVLASTLETVTLPDDLAAQLDGKSSLGRLGLLVHSTAGWIDPGWTGQVTLELSNVASLPIKLWPGMKIGQLVVMRMNGPAGRRYGSAHGSRYQGQTGPTPSRSHVGFRKGIPD